MPPTRRSLVVFLLGSASWTVQSYLLPFTPAAYYNARGRELRRLNGAAVTMAATRELINEVDLTDIRLAGWRAGMRVDEAPIEREDGMHVSSKPAVGDVIEFPIPERMKDQGDMRDKGVGVLLAINRDRKDADMLPEHLRDVCEVSVLTVDNDTDGELWKKDELEPNVYVRYDELKKVQATNNGGQDKWRRWKLLEQLSENCSAPPGAELEDQIV